MGPGSHRSWGLREDTGKIKKPLILQQHILMPSFGFMQVTWSCISTWMLHTMSCPVLVVILQEIFPSALIRNCYHLVSRPLRMHQSSLNAKHYFMLLLLPRRQKLAVFFIMHAQPSQFGKLWKPSIMPNPPLPSKLINPPQMIL